MDYSSKKLIVVAGPTAVGKTEVAIQLAEYYNTAVLSADSRQLFKELGIGTAKPDSHQLSRVPHHFISSHSIHDDFDAARFGEEALSLTYKLFKEYDYVIVCGGSGLYIKALLEGFDDIPEIPVEVRENLVAEYKQHGILWLQKKMEELDPEYLQQIDRQNPVRLMRALEVRTFTGKSISTFRKKTSRTLPFRVIKIGIEVSREELYQRIDKRMDTMISLGLFQEAEALYPLRKLNALQTVGYQEIFDFIEGIYDRDEAIRLLKRNSRRYAKRQFTWFKRDPEFVWMNPMQIHQMIELIDAT